MLFDELEEELSAILPTGFHIETNKKGQLIVFTGLTRDDDGEISDFVADEDDDEDLDASDDDFLPIEDEDDED